MLVIFFYQTVWDFFFCHSFNFFDPKNSQWQWTLHAGNLLMGERQVCRFYLKFCNEDRRKDWRYSQKAINSLSRFYQKHSWSPLSSVKTECERTQEADGTEGWSQKRPMHIMLLITEIRVPWSKSAFLKVSTSSCVSQTFYFNIP